MLDEILENNQAKQWVIICVILWKTVEWKSKLKRNIVEELADLLLSKFLIPLRIIGNNLIANMLGVCVY